MLGLWGQSRLTSTATGCVETGDLVGWVRYPVAWAVSARGFCVLGQRDWEPPFHRLSAAAETRIALPDTDGQPCHPARPASGRYPVRAGLNARLDGDSGAGERGILQLADVSGLLSPLGVCRGGSPSCLSLPDRSCPAQISRRLLIRWISKPLGPAMKHALFLLLFPLRSPPLPCPHCPVGNRASEPYGRPENRIATLGSGHPPGLRGPLLDRASRPAGKRAFLFPCRALVKALGSDDASRRRPVP